MSMTREQCEHYWARGWVVIDGVFPEATVDHVRALLMEDAAAELRRGVPEDLVDRADDGTPWLRKLELLFPRRPEYRDLVLAPPLVAILAQLLGDRPLVLGDMLFLKPPRVGTSKGYHQDDFHLRCDPVDQLITAWIALDDADPGNGCLHYIDGSHRGPRLAHAPTPGRARDWCPDPADIDRSRESPAPVRKGGVVLHHARALHTSYANASDRWRRGYCINWVTRAVTSTKTKVERAYFNQPEFAHLFA